MMNNLTHFRNMILNSKKIQKELTFVTNKVHFGKKCMAFSTNEYLFKDFNFSLNGLEKLFGHYTSSFLIQCTYQLIRKCERFYF